MGGGLPLSGSVGNGSDRVATVKASNVPNVCNQDGMQNCEGKGESNERLFACKPTKKNKNKVTSVSDLICSLEVKLKIDIYIISSESLP